MTLRSSAKQNRAIRESYYFALLVKNWLKSRLKLIFMMLFSPADFKLTRTLKQRIQGFFPENLNITNRRQNYYGKNIIGYPAMAHLQLGGQEVGWAQTNLEIAGQTLPLLQLKTDREINFPLLFKQYQPEYVIDFGTAAGGSAVLFYNLMKEYCQPKILSIDITDRDFKAAEKFHQVFQTAGKIKLLFGISSLDCLKEAEEFLKSRQPGQRVLLSFDDCHEYLHTYQELLKFSPLLQKGDVILMQDTWNQGLFGHEVSPMLAVWRFLNERPEFEQDYATNQLLTLPCNFIYGLIIKR